MTRPKARFANGVRIPPAAHRVLDAYDPEGERWPQPFATDGPDSFYAWLREPLALEHKLHLPRIALEIWKERHDLQRLFPHPRDEDLKGFALWLSADGGREEELTEPFVEPIRESLRRSEEERRGFVDGSVGRFSNGVGIPPRAREVLAAADPAGERWLFPAAAEGPRSFYRWLSEPDGLPSTIVLPRLASAIWDARADLRGAFPRPAEDDRRAFATWLSRSGETEEGLAAPFLEPTRASLRAAWERFAEIVPDVARLPAGGECFAGLGADDASWLAADATGDFGPLGAPEPWPPAPRFALLLRRCRADLRSAFPDPLGDDRARFAYWYLTSGWIEYGLPRHLVATVLAAVPRRRRLSAFLERGRARLRMRRPRPAPPPAVPPPPAETPADTPDAGLATLHDTWELLAQSDPLWAILSQDRMRKGRWDIQAFFDSGSAEIAAALRHLEELGVEVPRAAALDFGCGAGRLTRALARHFDRAVGIDISETMIELARHYSPEDEVAYVVNRRDDLGVFCDNSFSFVYTGRVLQHIRPELARRYVRELFRVLAPDGIVVFQAPGGERGGTAEESALPHDAYRARLVAVDAPRELVAGQSLGLTVEVTNASPRVWPSVEALGIYQIRLANQWLDADGRMLIPDQGRTALRASLGPGESRVLELIVWGPATPGRYVCRLDLVQEHVAWFSSHGSPHLDLDLKVVAAPAGGLGDQEHKLGQAAHTAIEMHSVARDEMVCLIEESGGEVVEITQDGFAGPEWVSFTYRARKSRSFRPFVHQPPPPASRLHVVPRRPVRRDWSAYAERGPDRALNRFSEALWHANPFLREHFSPDTAEGCSGLVRWIRQNLDVQRWLLPGGEPPSDRLAVPAAAGTTAAGVNVIDHPEATLGIHEDARLNVQALRAAAVPVTVAGVVNAEAAPEKADEWFRHGVNLFHVNADQMLLTFGRLGPQAFDGRYNIGYWLWELPLFPAGWASSFDLVDEVWVPSRYVYEALAPVSPVPVVHLPYPVTAAPDERATRAGFGIPEDSFLFVFSFDARSYVARKNPLAVVRAFRRAFRGGGERVGLVVKTAHLSPSLAGWSELREAADADPRIVVLDELLSRERMLALVALCDAYVSLHRAEGFGRGPAEAMLLGKPCVVTGYSGSEDYCTAETACRVDYRLVPVGAGEYPFPQGQVWAEPDVEHAAWHLRRLVDDAALRDRLAEAGRSFIRATYNPAVVGLRYRRRLESLGLLEPAPIDRERLYW